MDNEKDVLMRLGQANSPRIMRHISLDMEPLVES